MTKVTRVTKVRRPYALAGQFSRALLDTYLSAAAPAWLVVAVFLGVGAAPGAAGAAPGVAGAAPGVGGRSMRVVVESVVLAGTEPARLCFDAVVPGSVAVRSTYLAGGESIIYQEGRDYALDCARGTIARTPESRIPDFRTNVLYGKTDFDHNHFPGFGNGRFFAFVDYETRNGFPLAEVAEQTPLLAKTRARLDAGLPLKVVAYGDSITAGGDASSVALQFHQRYAQRLRERFPKADISVENGATGGDSTYQGLARLEEKVLSRKPDLVLIGFGMNDHNAGGVPLEQFGKNLAALVNAVRERTGAEVLLFSAFPPNPDWHYGTHQMERYAAATRQAAADLRCAYADVFAVWERVLRRKDLPSLLGNNINHPNDFGHWLYLQALEAVQF